MPFATVSTKGWVVIPATLRKKYFLKYGTNVSVIDYGGVLSIVPIDKLSLDDIKGKFKGKNKLTGVLLSHKKKENARERGKK